MKPKPNSLCDLAIEKLAQSGIDAEEALDNGLFSVENVREEYHREFKPLPGLILPYYNKDGSPMTFERDGQRLPFVRVRYLRVPKSFSAKSAKRARYSQHKGSGCRAYFTRTLDWSDVLSDPSNSLVIVEGELKALAGCLAGYPTIGLGGVRNFVSKIGGSRK